MNSSISNSKVQISDLADVYSSLPFGIVFISGEGEIISSNPAAEKIFEALPGQMAGRKVTALFSGAMKKDGSDFSEEKLPPMVSLRTGVELKNQVVGLPGRHKGGTRWISINSVPQFSEGKSFPYRVYCTFSDITEKIAVESQLKKSEEKYRALVDEMYSGLIIVQDGIIKFANNALSKMSGFEAKELKGKGFLDFIHPNEQQKVAEIYRERMAGKCPDAQYRTIGIRKNQNPVWLDIKSNLIYFEERPAVMVLLNDVDAEVKSEKKLQEAMVKAEESNRLKSAFLATISHEVRTPLNAILGFSEIMLNSADDPSIREYAEMIYGNGRSLLDIMNDILELALTEHGRIRLNPVEVKAEDLFNSFKGNFLELKNKAGSNNVKTCFSIDPQIKNKTLVVDKSKIYQVVLNLFKNALKFTEDGYIKLGCYEKDSEYVSIFVEDTGIGILPEQQEVIFEFFRQGDDSQTKKYGGIGVGLAISRKVAQMMNGDLVVESEPGEGAVFTLTIPKRID